MSGNTPAVNPNYMKPVVNVQQPSVNFQQPAYGQPMFHSAQPLTVQPLPNFQPNQQPVNFSNAGVVPVRGMGFDPNSPSVPSMPPAPLYTNIPGSGMNMNVFQMSTTTSTSTPNPTSNDPNINPKTGEPYLPGEKPESSSSSSSDSSGVVKPVDNQAYGVLFGRGAAATTGAAGAGGGVVAAIITMVLVILINVAIPIVIIVVMGVITGVVLGILACTGVFSRIS